MSTTKTKNRKKSQPKQQPRQVAGPLLVIQSPSAYEILSLIRNSIDIALGVAMASPVGGPLVSMPQYGSEMEQETFIQNWHHHHTNGRPRQYTPAPANSRPEQKTWRARVNEWITDYIGPREAGRTDEDYRQAYKGAYRQLMLRYGIDVEQRARNLANKHRKANQDAPAGNEPLDFVERLGCMEELFKIVCEIYPLHEVDPSLRSEPVLAGA